MFINFYADWCRFSNMLAPVWDEAANSAKTEFPAQGKVFFGKVDCDKEGRPSLKTSSDFRINRTLSGSLGTRFHITKYPTLKYVQNGMVAKREYRGQRSAEAFVNFVKEQTLDPVLEVKDLGELGNLDVGL